MRGGKTAAVTGASGHLGANLIRLLLEDGWRVRALIHDDTRAVEGLDIECVRGEVLEPESLVIAFENVDVVFHLAGRISIGTRDRQEVEAVNIDGVRNVVDACLKCRVKRLIHASSFHAHVQEPLDKPLDESRQLLDTGYYPPYNYSKAEGERIVQSAIANGLDAVIVNPGGIIGPNDFKPSFFGNIIISMMKGNLPAIVDAGLGWVDARDVARAMINACDCADTGAKYMLGGDWVSLQEVAGKVASLAGVRPPAFTLPLWAARQIAPIAAYANRVMGRTPRFTPISIRELEGNRFISYEKAGKELQFHPRPLEETLADTVDWFSKNGYKTV